MFSFLIGWGIFWLLFWLFIMVVGISDGRDTNNLTGMGGFFSVVSLFFLVAVLIGGLI